MEPVAVPAGTLGVERRLERQHRDRGNRPKREAAPEEDAERRDGGALTAGHYDVRSRESAFRGSATRTIPEDARFAAAGAAFMRTPCLRPGALARIISPVPERLFTPEEANAALAQVGPLVERLVERRATSSRAQARLAELVATVAGNGGGLDPARAQTLVTAVGEAETLLAETLSSLAEAGVIVRDADAGLVDFPAVREGLPVFLCWQLGEESVAWWHDPDGGFAGRKPLE